MSIKDDGQFCLEALDFFVIDDKPQKITNQMGLEVQIVSDYEGAVFQAIEVCGEHVAARVIEREADESEKPIVLSLNWRRHNVSFVTETYAKAIMNSKKLPTNLDGFPDMDMAGFGDDMEDDDDEPRRPS